MNLLLDWHATKDFRIITGPSRSGKTTLGLKLFGAPGAKYRFVFDPDREFSKKMKMGVCETVQQMELALANRGIVLFDPGRIFGSDKELGYAFFSRWVFNVCGYIRGQKRLLVDELWKYCPGKGALMLAQQEIMNEGRKRGIHGIFIFHSVNQCHEKIRMQTDWVYTFRHVDKLPLDWLEEEGFDRQEVITLPDFVYLCRDRNRCIITRSDGASHGQRKRNSQPIR